MKKKGFTLIELLAVIVILAIIALIATPIILGVVNDAKKSASISSAYGYVESIEKEYMLNIIKENNIVYMTDEEMNIADSPIGDIKIQGNKPSKGFVTLNEDGTVRKGTFCIDNFKVVYNDKKAEISDQNCSTIKASIKENSILYKARQLVYNDESCKTDGTTYNYMGGCYIKGQTTSNYVWYSGFLWRIMGINADSTVRMITEEGIANVLYGEGNTAEQYDNSYLKEWLNNYFINKLNNNSIINNQAWCSETTTDYYSKRTTCTNNLSTVNAKVGLLSFDELNLSGNTNSYLKNGQYTWLITPKNSKEVWIGDNNGNAAVAESFRGNNSRPIINIRASATITSGNGTLNATWTKDAAPFILNENKIGVSITGKKINENVTSGEYVKFDNRLYRIVGKEDSGVKLILDGYYTANKVGYGSTAQFSLTDGIGSYLNSTIYSWLFSNQTAKDKIVTSSWNRGEVMKQNGADYKTTSLAETNPVANVKVGLIKMGEMLSGQSQTINTKQEFLTFTPSVNVGAEQYTWYIDVAGGSNTLYTKFNAYVRPVIIVKNDLNITGGNGTPSNPYEI